MMFWIVPMSGLLWSFSVLSASAEDVTGSVNGAVTLPCNYSSSKATYAMCWGRGKCSLFHCTKKILETDGRKVTWRKFDRYKLSGNISLGDVSMTITGATKEDEGSYCCRVEIPGPFNDKVTDVTLKIEEDKIHEDSRELPTNPPTHWTFTISDQTFSSNLEPQNRKIETYVIFLSVTLVVILFAVILYIYKFKKRKADVRTGLTELNNLSRPANQTAENFYIMD